MLVRDSFNIKVDIRSCARIFMFRSYKVSGKDHGGSVVPKMGVVWKQCGRGRSFAHTIICTQSFGASLVLETGSGFQE